VEEAVVQDQEDLAEGPGNPLTPVLMGKGPLLPPMDAIVVDKREKKVRFVYGSLKFAYLCSRKYMFWITGIREFTSRSLGEHLQSISMCVGQF
jgi:hypothetical protein